jgi:hypothetical protein
MTQTPAEQFGDWLRAAHGTETAAEPTGPPIDDLPADPDAGKPHGDIGQGARGGPPNADPAQAFAALMRRGMARSHGVWQDL